MVGGSAFLELWAVGLFSLQKQPGRKGYRVPSSDRVRGMTGRLMFQIVQTLSDQNLLGKPSTDNKQRLLMKYFKSRLQEMFKTFEGLTMLTSGRHGS